VLLVLSAKMAVAIPPLTLQQELLLFLLVLDAHVWISDGLEKKSLMACIHQPLLNEFFLNKLQILLEKKFRKTYS